MNTYGTRAEILAACNAARIANNLPPFKSGSSLNQLCKNYKDEIPPVVCNMKGKKLFPIELRDLAVTSATSGRGRNTYEKAFTAALSKNPDYIRLRDLLPIVNADRLKRGVSHMKLGDLVTTLVRCKCLNIIAHTSPGGHIYRIWHKAHAIDIISSLSPRVRPEKTTNIWAVLPEQYRDDPNWMTIREAAARTGLPVTRVKSMCKESGNKRVFLHPETKRRLCYLPEIKDAMNWRNRRFVLKHCTREQARHIFATARKKVKRTLFSRSTIYYVPELAHL